jgi:hypothetical protein
MPTKARQLTEILTHLPSFQLHNPRQNAKNPCPKVALIHMNIRNCLALCLLITTASISIHAAPPKVIKTIPANNDQNVDPNLKELRVVFDQPMAQTGSKFVGTGPKCPKFGPPEECRWEDDKTLVYTWKLEPNHEYWLSVNSEHIKTFKNESGESAVPYPISFKTSDGKGGTQPSRESAPASTDTTASANTTTEAIAPKVVSANPDNGDKDVDPDLKELRVVFDQPMIIGNMSIVGGGPNFPKIVGTPKWENDRTIVAKISLEPNHKYSLSFNGGNFNNFKGTNGISAEPYPVQFTTRATAEADATTPPAAFNSKDAIAKLQKALDEDYSYRDLRKINWSNVFKQYTPQLESCDKNWKFARQAGKMLAVAQDLHMWLQVDDEFIPTYKRNAQWNIATARLPKQIPDWTKRSELIYSGRFEDGIRYVFIRSFPANKEADMEPFFDVLNECITSGRSLIIDVRANGGGAEPLAAQLAGCFTLQPVVYAKDIIRKDGKFSAPLSRTLEPNNKHDPYTGYVAVLTGAGTVSSAESFVLMMKQYSRCTVIGQPTAGASGNPKPVDLGGGIQLYLPSWQDLRPDGTCFEGEGIAPDIEVKTGPNAFDSKDPVIEAALKHLRDK